MIRVKKKFRRRISRTRFGVNKGKMMETWSSKRGMTRARMLSRSCNLFLKSMFEDWVILFDDYIGSKSYSKYIGYKYVN